MEKLAHLLASWRNNYDQAIRNLEKDNILEQNKKIEAAVEQSFSSIRRNTQYSQTELLNVKVVKRVETLLQGLRENLEQMERYQSDLDDIKEKIEAHVGGLSSGVLKEMYEQKQHCKVAFDYQQFHHVSSTFKSKITHLYGKLDDWKYLSEDFSFFS